MNVTSRDLRQAARDLGLAGLPICIHSSLRSFGWVDGGAPTVVEGLLAAGCTVLVPSFSESVFGAPPPAGRRPERNGIDYEALSASTSGPRRVYTPDSHEVNRTMGAIPAMIARWPGRVRGDHPLN